MKSFKIIEVSWIDSNMFIQQESLACEEFQPVLIHSIGFELKRDKKMVVLFGDLIDLDCRRTIVIPMKSVVKIRELN